MLPKTILCYVLKCLNSGKVKAETLGRLLNSFLMHLHVEFKKKREGYLTTWKNPLRNCTAYLLNHFSQKSLCQIFLVSATFWFSPAYVNLRINMFDYNWKIKRDLPVSWSLIEILSVTKHWGITWDSIAPARTQFLKHLPCVQGKENPDQQNGRALKGRARNPSVLGDG